MASSSLPSTLPAAGSTRLLTLSDVFERISTWVRETPESSDVTSSQDVKLRLYGLYKHITCGPCHPSSTTTNEQATPPSIFQPVARAKYQAWLACQDLSKDEAMWEYVKLIASQQHWLGMKCQDLLQQYQEHIKSQQQQVVEAETEPNDEGTAQSERSLTCQKVDADADEKQGIPDDIKESTLDMATTAKKSEPTTTTSLNQSLQYYQQPHEKQLSSNATKQQQQQQQPLHGCWSEKWLGVTPVIPRGQLDIGSVDLCYATWQCAYNAVQTSTSCRYHQLDQSIKKLVTDAVKRQQQQQQQQPTPEHTNNNSNSLHVVVGFSVRTLLDLFLMAKKYPPNSEVIMVPPINIPSMVHVLEYHQLQVVAVDLPLDSNGDHSINVAVDVHAVEKAISERTVAILVVHPFGMISASESTMKQLYALTRAHKLDLLEDCAECYAGLEGSDAYLGSPYATVSFFSFGMIKTCTALGGALALIRQSTIARNDLTADSSSIAIKMDRTQFSLYKQAPLREYVWKIIRAIIICIATSHPMLYGFIILCFQQLSIDFDAVAVKLTRSFVMTSRSESCQAKQHGELIASLRKRPSNALLALLRRRLCYGGAARSVTKRKAACSDMTQQLTQHPEDGITLVTVESGKNLCWLYPVGTTTAAPPHQVCQSLRRRGFDATHGMSQLGCIVNASTSIRGGSCPQAQRFMDHVVYLPVGNLSHGKILHLANTLQRVVDGNNNNNKNECENHDTSTADCRKRFRFDVAVVVAVVLDFILFRGSMVSRRLLRAVPFIATCWLQVILLSILVSQLLRWGIADFYLESSTCFARFNSMLCDASTKSAEQADADNNEGSKERTSETASQASVLSKIEALQLVPNNNVTTNTLARAFVTGATGFVGSLLLRDILRLRGSLGFHGGVVILCRSKRGKSASDRIAELLRSEMFSFLSDTEKATLVTTVEGDVAKPKAGLSESDWEFACHQANISHVFHCAASVSFTLTLLDSARANISSALTMQHLAAQMNGKVKFVHISTAFVHGGQAGSESKPLPEQLFPLDPYSPTKIYDSMLGTQFYASKAMFDLGFPNTYTFSKCVCEHLLSQQSPSVVETIIIRPSIVGPAIENPCEGWAGDKPQTIVAAASLYMSYQWNLWCFGAYKVPVIPVDVVSRFILVKAVNSVFPVEQSLPCESEAHSSDDDFERISKSSEGSSLSGDVDPLENHTSSASSESCEAQYGRDDQTANLFNAVWNVSSPQSTTFTWLQYAVAVTQLGSILGYFAKSSSYLGLFFAAKLQPTLHMTQGKYERLHSWLVQVPLNTALYILEKLGWRTSHWRVLAKFIDLPILFFPFMSRNFCFKSDLLAPVELCGDRYLFACVVAAERFLTNQQKRTKSHSGLRHSGISKFNDGIGVVVGGRAYKSLVSDFWWALTQPRGGYCLRVAAWIFAKILRATCTEVMIDVTSFSAVAEALSRSNASPLHVVLAPTHRSLFDSFLLSFALFAVPELQVDIPFVVAADDFSRLPLIGWFASSLNAFYVQRGKCLVDQSLRDNLQTLKNSKSCRFGGVCIEVFIEGTRSRDRRFVAPKTGFLRCLEETGGEHLFVPITINYERIPEQSMFVADLASGTRCQLSIGGLFTWLIDVARGNVRLGRVIIIAGKPVRMNDIHSNSMAQLTNYLQREQQSRIYASDYHIKAAAVLLNKEVETVRACLNKLGCLEWPKPSLRGTLRDEVEVLQLPDDPSELFTIMLQFGHFLSPLIRISHPQWAQWLNKADDDTQINDDIAVQETADALSMLFEAASAAVVSAETKLAAKGFIRPTPDHLFQTAAKMRDRTPLLLLRSALSFMQVSHLSVDVREAQGAALVKAVLSEDNDVDFGRWGFNDTRFFMQLDRDGKSFVTMSGKRYSMCGKRLTKLIPFIENQTQIKIDPTREIIYPRFNSGECCPSALTLSDVEQLRSSVPDYSLSDIDRARCGSGQSQEDVFLLRRNISFRIPDAVVRPSSEIEIEELVGLARKLDWNLVPVGGGTNVTSATRCLPRNIDPRPVVSVCMQKMDRILWVNEEDGLAHVEAGITGKALSEELHHMGFTVGHEPDSNEFSTLGGWIATKASGMKKNKYGNIEDIVKSVRVATCDGMVWQGYSNKPFNTVPGRESKGLDLCSMMLGSEGCFGIITSAVIRISHLPEVKDFDCVLFTDFDCGLRFVRDVARLGHNIPASVRLLDNAHFRLGRALQPTSSCFQNIANVAKLGYMWWSGGFVEESVVCATIAYEGSRDEWQSQRKAIRRLSSGHGGIQLGPRAGRESYDLTFVIAYLRDFAMSYDLIGESFETFAPWSKIESIIQSTKESIRKEHEIRSLPGVPFIGCRVTQLYHEGVCLYFYLCLSTHNVENPSDTFAEIERLARTQILESGGSLTHHHGIGKLRAPFTKRMDSDSLKTIIKSFKQSIDSFNIFGVGNGIFFYPSEEIVETKLK